MGHGKHSKEANRVAEVCKGEDTGHGTREAEVRSGSEPSPWGDGRGTVTFVSGGSSGMLVPAHSGSRKSASQLCSVSS